MAIGQVVIDRRADQRETIATVLEAVCEHLPRADGYFNVSSCACGAKFRNNEDWKAHMRSLVISQDEVDAESTKERG